MKFFQPKLGGPSGGQALGEKNKLWEGAGILFLSASEFLSVRESVGLCCVFPGGIAQSNQPIQLNAAESNREQGEVSARGSLKNTCMQI